MYSNGFFHRMVERIDMIKQIKFKLIAVIFLGVLVIVACKKDNGTSPDDQNSKITKHVMVIGVDGLMPAAVKTANTPHLDELIEDGAVSYNAFAGGVFGSSTQQPTSSGPSWSSILTGVWLDKHNVPNNSFSDPDYENYPCFFKRLKEKKADAYCSSIVQWTPINTHIITDADYMETGSGGGVAIKTISHLSKENPDAIFLHFDDVDGAGHGYGYSPTNPKYLSAISSVDSLIGIVIRGINNRSNFASEDWLIIVVCDHGGIGTGHGGQSPEERTAFLLASGGSVTRDEVSSGPGIVAVPPTVFEHLGIEVDSEWGWAGQPFGYE